MLDEVIIEVAGGDGGHGLVSYRREKFIPHGGPDGGDGGRGGRVYLSSVDDVYTLEQFRSKRRFKAGNGGNGGPNQRTGVSGGDLYLAVPAGTVVHDAETGDVIADLPVVGKEVIVAFGGRGGWGNKRFATSTNQTPSFSQKGHVGEQVVLRLELRLLADVGLIGLPNAGKSTLLAAVSKARPKIGAYPFTTLEPMLGVVAVGYDRFTLADLPGLVEGASEGYGLGFEFLKHIRRCRVLLHLIDASSPDPITDYELIESELRAYDPSLEAVARVVAVTKIDLLNGQEAEAAAVLAEYLGTQVDSISAATGAGIENLVAELMDRVRQERTQAGEGTPSEVAVLRPQPRERFFVTRVGGSRFMVEGTRVVSFVEMMDTEMEGARAEIDRRLERWGVARALRRAGAHEGDTIVFGETELTWEG